MGNSLSHQHLLNATEDRRVGRVRVARRPHERQVLAAVDHDADALRERVGLLHVVRREDERAPSVEQMSNEMQLAYSGNSSDTYGKFIISSAFAQGYLVEAGAHRPSVEQMSNEM